MQPTEKMFSLLASGKDREAWDLIQSTPNLNLEGVHHPETKTLLHYAIIYNSDSTLQYILSQNIDVEKCTELNRDHTDVTPLHLAAMQDKKNTVELLLKRGANRQSKSSKGITAEQFARQKGYTEIADRIQKFRGPVYSAESEIPKLMQEVDNNVPTNKMVGELLRKSTLSGSNIISLICKHYTMLDNLFKGDSLVWQGYTVKEHTVLFFEQLKRHQNLGQYEKSMQSVQRILPNVRSLFLVCIALHDLGKVFGDHSKQHLHNKPIVEKLLTVWGFSKEEIIFGQSLIDHDMVGKLLQGKAKIDDIEKQLKTNCNKTKGLTFKDYFHLQAVLYLSDAGSYPELYKASMQEKATLSFAYLPANNIFQQLESRFQSDTLEVVGNSIEIVGSPINTLSAEELKLTSFVEAMITKTKQTLIIGAGNVLNNIERTGGWSMITALRAFNNPKQTIEYCKKKNQDKGFTLQMVPKFPETWGDRRVANGLLHRTGNCGVHSEVFSYFVAASSLKELEIFSIDLDFWYNGFVSGTGAGVIDHYINKIIYKNSIIYIDPLFGIYFLEKNFDAGMRKLLIQLKESYIKYGQAKLQTSEQIVTEDVQAEQQRCLSRAENIQEWLKKEELVESSVKQIVSGCICDPSMLSKYGKIIPHIVPFMIHGRTREQFLALVESDLKDELKKLAPNNAHRAKYNFVMDTLKQYHKEKASKTKPEDKTTPLPSSQYKGKLNIV